MGTDVASQLLAQVPARHGLFLATRSCDPLRGYGVGRAGKGTTLLRKERSAVLRFFITPWKTGRLQPDLLQGRPAPRSRVPPMVPSKRPSGEIAPPSDVMLETDSSPTISVIERLVCSSPEGVSTWSTATG